MRNHTFRLLLAAAAAITSETQGNGAPKAAAGASGQPTDKPTTPEQLRDLKLPQLIEQKPSYQTLLEIGLGALMGFIKEGIELGNKVKSAATELKSKAKPLGKIIAAAKVAYNEAQKDGTLSNDVTFADYIVKVNGAKPQDTASWNHAQQCAVVFAELVLTDRITEADYDNRSGDALQKACTILNLNKKKGDDLNSPAVTDLIDVLLNAPDDERMERLNKLRNKLSGKETVNKNGTGPELDMPNFVAILKRGIEMDFNGVAGLSLALDEVVVRVPKETREDVLKLCMFKLVKSLDSCGTAQQQETWVKEANARVVNPESVNAPKPAELKKAA